MSKCHIVGNLMHWLLSYLTLTASERMTIPSIFASIDLTECHTVAVSGSPSKEEDKDPWASLSLSPTV